MKGQLNQLVPIYLDERLERVAKNKQYIQVNKMIH